MTEKQAGRPALYNEEMIQTAIMMPEYMREWLKSQPGGMSAELRRLVELEIERKFNE